MKKHIHKCGDEVFRCQINFDKELHPSFQVVKNKIKKRVKHFCYGDEPAYHLRNVYQSGPGANKEMLDLFYQHQLFLNREDAVDFTIAEIEKEIKNTDKEKSLLLKQLRNLK